MSGRRLRDARLGAGLTQAQLARRVNTSERNIVRWETEANVPRLKHLAAIAEVTGKDVGHFLASDDEAEAASMAPLAADTTTNLAAALEAAFEAAIARAAAKGASA